MSHFLYYGGEKKVSSNFLGEGILHEPFATK
jgi:hypothetical protein